MRRPFILPCSAVALALFTLTTATSQVAQAQAHAPAVMAQATPAPAPSVQQSSGAPQPVPAQAEIPPAAPMPPPPAIEAIPLPPPPPVIETLPPLPPPPPPPPPPPAAKATVSSKFAVDVYGFTELDGIFDTTQSFNEIAGNGVIAKKGTYGGDHGRLTYSVRNSRFGLKIKGPESDKLKASAMLEMDFLGNQPSDASEAQLITNGTFRTRHAALKLETPIVDVLAGQFWQLFGWGSYFFPNSVQIMGLPGQVFSRAPQLRVSRAFKGDAVTLEVAIASARSPQRDSALPDNQAGVRLLFNKWKALHTANSTGTAVDPMGIGVSGVYRQLHVSEFAVPAERHHYNSKNAGGISIDGLIPVIPATMDNRANALTLTGSYVRGTGIADLFTGLNGGIVNPPLPGQTTAFTPNIDRGLVVYGPGGDLHTIDWQSFMFGFQYYLPPSGSVWISANYSQMNSPNMHLYAENDPALRGSVFKQSQFADGNLFFDVNKAVRLGAEVAWFKQKFVDYSTATNWRCQMSAFYMF